MGYVACLVIGLVAGIVSGALVSRAGSGLITDIVLGVIGALVGGVLFHVFGNSGVTGFSLYSVLSDTAGAVGMLFLFHALAGRRNI